MNNKTTRRTAATSRRGKNDARCTQRESSKKRKADSSRREDLL
nr:MAG TPA: hypothetical protein [Caudoviricetes sp.]